MDILTTLKNRFIKHQERHPDIQWQDVESRLKKSPAKLQSLSKMEETGGEPDVIGTDKETGEIIFCDCSPESPKERRSVCYDAEARNARKEHKPKTSAVEMAKSIGIELLTEDQYRQLQELGAFDLKTSSWIYTPQVIRDLDGALFCDRRYNHVFTYHNGVQSYYASRGFRGVLKV